MTISKFSINRQITLVMFYALVIGFSFFSFSQLKIDFFPDIQFPIAGVITNYNGVGPEDIENLITRPLEESVSSVKNIEKVSSQSFKGASIITCEFKFGTDMDQAELDLRKNIDLIREFLPDDASEPLVFVFDPSMSPILFMNLSSQYLGPAELRRLSEDKIEPLLERVEGVASVQTQGGLKRQINVNLNPTLLAAYSLSPDDVAAAIGMGSGLLPAGTIETESKNFNLRVFSEYSKIDQIMNTVVTVKGTDEILVKDVADVEDGYKESTTEVRADFGEGIMILITKQSDANTILTSEAVVAALPDIEERLPEGTRFNVIWDQSEFILRSINNLRNTALIAFVMAFIVIYIFLRNWRGSVIMGISIPVSVVATFAVLYATDLTLNIISMAGLALAVGMLVDNSIVVLENIYRHRELGEDRKQSAEFGAKEVGMAITASTLTTISVFLPVLFVPNITGQLFKDMVLTITFSLIVSLFVALTLVPMMSSNILKVASNNNNSSFGKLKNRIGKWIESMTVKYTKLLHWSLHHRKTVLGAVTALFIISIAISSTLGGEFLPKSDQGFINILIESPSGNSIEKTRLYVYELEDMVNDVLEEDELQSISIFFGNREGIGAFGTTASTIEMFVRLTSVENRTRSQFEIQDLFRERLDNIPGITYIFQEGGAFSNEKDIEVKVIGFDIDGAINIANGLKSKMEKIEGLVDISMNIKETTPEMQIHLNKDMLNELKLSSLQVASNISTAIQGKVVSQYREAGDEYDIYVQFAKNYRNKKESLEEIQIAMPTGHMIPLREIAELEEAESTPTIFRENQSRFVSVGCGLSGTDLSTAVSEIEKVISDTPIPSEYQVIIGGTAEDQQEAFFYLGLAFMAAILLVYMIMAAQFESFVDPLIIMFTVPLSIIGVFIFLFITNTSLSVMALVGLVMLVGIAVNNGIVLVDYINQIRNKGVELFNAVEEASKARMRPVLMTAATTILGMVPLAIEMGSGAETWSPLARAVIGGLTTTTLLTLIVIPVLYIIFERFEMKIKSFVRKKLE
ncbi:MAG: efflux RND transporter permease subunit [Melioribacteraceae bacterium]|nr:efflux RND transporter permease subunit [Melioribacteraceae bacterium]MCF8419881.1 efflux RND transporter permease subunit [Melioribacteraceae bacterium]